MREPPFFTTPVPASTRRILLVTVAVTGLLLARPVLIDEPLVIEQTEPWWAWSIVAIWTGLASIVHLRIASGAATPGGAVLRSVALGPFLGFLDAALSLGTIALLRSGRVEDGVTGFILAGMFGAPVAGLRGLAFGIGHAPLVALAVDHRRAPTHEGRDVALMASGLALGIAALLREALAPEPAGWAVIAAAAAVPCLALGAVGVARRRLFVARVCAGRVAGWSVDVDGEAPASTSLFPATGGAAASVLYRSVPVGEGPYRGAAAWTPVARIAPPR